MFGGGCPVESETYYMEMCRHLVSAHDRGKKTKINGKKAPAANRLILHKKEKKKKREKEKDAALVSSSNSRPPPAHLIWRSNILKRECSTVSQSMR